MDKKRVFPLIVILFVTMFISSVLAADVAYLVTNDPEPEFIDVMNDMGISYDIIYYTEIENLDFSDYKMILINNDYFVNWDDIPINEMPAVVAGGANIADWGWSTQSTIVSGLYRIYVDVDTTHELTGGLPDNFAAYTSVGPEIYLLDAVDIYRGFNILASNPKDNRDAVVAFVNGGTTLTHPEPQYPDTYVGANSCFFGIYNSDYWTEESKDLFKSCFDFVHVECEIDADCPQEEEGDSYCSGGDVYVDVTIYSCVENECVGNPVPELFEDCGDDYCDDWGGEYCSNGDVYHSRVCYDVGCSSGGCIENPSQPEEELVDSCNFGCSNGECNPECTEDDDCEEGEICSDNECVEVDCETDDDCPDDYETDRYCVNNEVHYEDISYSCQNYVCEEETIEVVDEICSDTCVEGVCEEIECYSNYDCGINLFLLDNYCMGGHSYRDFISFSCLNAGTIHSFCHNYTIPILIDYCEGDCVDGECLEIPECEVDDDCGDDGFIGNPFCYENDVYQDYQEFECLDGECFDETSQTLVEECAYGCDEGECVEVECKLDSDCDYLDEDYCLGDEVTEKKGICVDNSCVENVTTIEVCGDKNGIMNECGEMQWSCSEELNQVECVLNNVNPLDSLCSDDYCVGDNRNYNGECNLISYNCDYEIEFCAFGCLDGICEEEPKECYTNEDCDYLDDRYNTGNFQWVENDQCTEKEQEEIEYRDFYCEANICEYDVDDSGWVDTGEIRNKQDGISCDDGDACTVDDVCASGVCSGIALDCDDGNVCTDDSCDSLTGCQNTFNVNPCRDGDLCTENDVCTEGVCIGVPINCDDGIACTVDSCDAGVCQNDPVACECSVNTDCRDGNICTDDVCNQDYECEHTNNANSCDDGLFCTENDVCSSGTCGGIARDCSQNDLIEISTCNYSPDDNPITWDYFAGFTSICDEDANECTELLNWEDLMTHSPHIRCGAQCRNNGDCDDGLYCNGVETCENNVCVSGQEINCDDSVSCTVDSCNEISDSCDNLPDDNYCDNNEFCDGFETCDVLLGCQTGIPVDCDDSNECTLDLCNEEIDECVYGSEEDGVLCGEERICLEDSCSGLFWFIYPENGHDYCFAGECIEYDCSVLDSFCDLGCGAECIDDDCENYCEANTRYYNGNCDNCVCDYDDEVCEFGCSAGECIEPECTQDEDCDYLDEDYCLGDEVTEKKGICVDNSCVENVTTIEVCGDKNGIMNECGEMQWSCSEELNQVECVLNNVNPLDSLCLDNCQGDILNFNGACNPITYNCDYQEEQCLFDCVNAECVGECSDNLDCGDDGFIGNPFCYENDVYQDYQEFFCIIGECINGSSPKLIEECEDYCADGSCVECRDDFDCPEGVCLEGECVDCREDSDCGIDGFIGDAYCSDKNVYQEYREYSCSSNSCEYEDREELIEECSYDCEEGECLDCDFYQGRWMCLDSGYNPTTKLSDYVTDWTPKNPGCQIIYSGDQDACGNFGSYYIGSACGASEIKVTTPSLPRTGKYKIQFEYGVGSAGQNNENFVLRCGSDEYVFDDPGCAEQYYNAEVVCDFDAGENVFYFEGNEDSVHFDKFKIDSFCPECEDDEDCENGYCENGRCVECEPLRDYNQLRQENGLDDLEIGADGYIILKGTINDDLRITLEKHEGGEQVIYCYDMFDQPGGCPSGCNSDDDLCIFSREGTLLYNTNIMTGISPALGKPLGSEIKINVEEGDVLTFDKDPADPYWNIGLEIWDARCPFNKKYDSGWLCLDSSFKVCDDPTKVLCSQYVVDYDAYNDLWNGLMQQCGQYGSYTIGYLNRKSIDVRTPYISEAGNYVVEFDAGLGSLWDYDTGAYPEQDENFRVICNGVGTDFLDDGRTPEDWYNYQINCNLNQGENIIRFESLTLNPESSVHLDRFRIYKL